MNQETINNIKRHVLPISVTTITTRHIEGEEDIVKREEVSVWKKLPLEHKLLNILFPIAIIAGFIKIII